MGNLGLDKFELLVAMLHIYVCNDISTTTKVTHEKL